MLAGRFPDHGRLGAGHDRLVDIVVQREHHLRPLADGERRAGDDGHEGALEALAAGNTADALAQARTAVARDPLSPFAKFALASAEQAGGQAYTARATLEEAVREQPSNPQTWLELARNELSSSPRLALHALQATIYLNPESIAPENLADNERVGVEIHNDYIEALQAAGGQDAAQ